MNQRILPSIISLGAVAYLGLATPTSTNGALVIAEDLIVNLDAQSVPLGSQGTWGDFSTNVGADPVVEDITAPIGVGNGSVPGLSGASVTVRGFTFSGDNGMVGPQAPAGVVGLNPTRSVEVWVHNNAIPGEEGMVSWGRRGGPDGSAMTFNYGNNSNFGAVTHWGGGQADMSWTDNTNSVTGAPAASHWQHLVYTFDGSTTRVYAGGTLLNEELLPANLINTHTPHEFRLAHSVNADGTTPTLFGSLTLAQVRIHDGVLSDADVLNNYNEGPMAQIPEPATAGLIGLLGLSLLLRRRRS